MYICPNQQYGILNHRILFLIPKNDIGGAPKFVKEQIDICHQQGIRCYLSTNQTGWIEQGRADKIEGALYDTRIESMTSIGFLFALIKFIRKHNIELTVCNSANGGLYGRLAAFLTGSASVYVTHGWSSIYNGGRFSFLLNFIERMLAYLGTKVLCISKGDLEKALRIIKVPTTKIAHINNAIIPSASTHQAGLHQPVRLLMIARFKRPKRVDLFLEAMATMPQYHAYIAGDGEQRQTLESQKENLQLQNTTFLGELSDFNEFNEYDIFVLLSDSEGLPMSAIEAMSHGLPLVLSNVGGCPELIDGNGFLVDNQVDAIRHGIEECIANYEAYAGKSLMNYNHAFNLINRQNEFIHLYLDCIKK